MKKISLRALSLGDTDNIVKWRNLPSVKKNLYSQAELKPEQHIAYFENVVKNGKCAQFIIVVEDEGLSTDIGTIFIKNIDNANHSGEYGIFIGEESARGKGYAKIATEQILKFGFDTLGLHRIYLTVMSDNIPAIKTYENSGFVREGVMRDEYLRIDGYVDVVMMSILKQEWETRKNENIPKTNNIG